MPAEGYSMSKSIRLKDLKGAIHPSATQYLVPGKSHLAKSRLFDACAGKIHLKSFASELQSVDLLEFCWTDGHSDRNWWWQLQQLNVFTWCVSCWSLMDSQEKETAVDFLKKVLLQWIDAASDNSKSPLAWHDHGTAFRLRNIINWLTLIILDGDYLCLITDAESEKIIETISDHIIFLRDEKYYTRHTNHGFDQALVLCTTSLLWEGVSIFEGASQLAIARLLDEIDYAFTEQGVHKENSPGYQKFMIGRLDQLKDLRILGASFLSDHSSAIQLKAEKFLSAMTMPNGFLPLIGDTRGEDLGSTLKADGEFQVFDYSESGYVVSKGVSSDGSPFHFVFKNAHASSFHRHDDDLSFHLFFNGMVVFGDGGLYSFNEKDPLRVFLRSPYAHNTVFPSDSAMIRDPKKLTGRPQCSLLSAHAVRGVSNASGIGVIRSIDFSNLQEGELLVIDRFSDAASANPSLMINFFLPESHGISKSNNVCTINLPNCTVKIVTEVMPDSVDFYRGVNGHGAVKCALSSSYGEFVEASRATFKYDDVGDKSIMHRITVASDVS
jgi:hypothetical protein